MANEKQAPQCNPNFRLDLRGYSCSTDHELTSE